MNVTLTNERILETVQHIINFQQTRIDRNLNYGLSKIKEKLKKQEMIIKNELNDYHQKRIDLCLKYCEKDKNNNHGRSWT